MLHVPLAWYPHATHVASDHQLSLAARPMVPFRHLLL